MGHGGNWDWRRPVASGRRDRRSPRVSGRHVLGGPAVEVPARASHVVDTVGAGDCFAAALTVALAERRPLAEAARWAVVAAGLAVERRGAQTGMPHRSEVDAACRDR